MKKKVLFLLAALFIATATTGADPVEQGPGAGVEGFIAECGRMVDGALAAYNSGDSKNFYRDFSKERLGRDSRSFKAIWVEGYGGEFGRFLTKELDEKFCDFNPVYPMLVYRAKFEKNGYVTIKAIFVKEGGAYRIFYLRFDSLPPGTI